MLTPAAVVCYSSGVIQLPTVTYILCLAFSAFLWSNECVCAEEFDARHNFSESANWLVPGYIMVGEYPFVNGSSCTDYNDGEARLQQALKAGITAFASMLGELPSQTEMPIGGVKNFVPYKPTADLIAAGACFSAAATQYMHLSLIHI